MGANIFPYTVCIKLHVHVVALAFLNKNVARLYIILLLPNIGPHFPYSSIYNNPISQIKCLYFKSSV